MPDEKPVTKHMSERTAKRLKRVADTVGEVTYADIEEFDAAWPGMLPEKIFAMTALLERVEAADAKNIHRDAAAMDALRALGEILRPAEAPDDTCVCPFCGSDIPDEDIIIDEWTGIADATCPACGKTCSYLADG